jgi:DNA/RNA endonuclease YhcR with UshA esterase domain
MCDSLKIDLVLSEDEEPKVKVKKQNKEKPVPKKIKPRIKSVKKSIFGQVRLKIYEVKYKKWIAKENRKICEFFPKKKGDNTNS